MNRPPEPPLLKEKKPVLSKSDKYLGWAYFAHIAKHSNAQEKGLAQNAEEKLTGQKE